MQTSGSSGIDTAAAAVVYAYFDAADGGNSPYRLSGDAQNGIIAEIIESLPEGTGMGTAARLAERQCRALAAHFAAGGLLADRPLPPARKPSALCDCCTPAEDPLWQD